MYLTTTRLDIMYEVSLTSRFIKSPNNSYWEVGKKILRYIVGTMNHGNLYSTLDDFQLVGYINSNFLGNTVDRRRTSRYAFHLEIGVVAWASKNQSVVTLSPAELEYVARKTIASQVVWMRRILKDLMQAQDGPTTIYCDNKFAIASSKNHVFHENKEH